MSRPYTIIGNYDTSKKVHCYLVVKKQMIYRNSSSTLRCFYHSWIKSVVMVTDGEVCQTLTCYYGNN